VVYSATFISDIVVAKSTHTLNNGLFNFKLKKASKGQWAQLFSKIKNTEKTINQKKIKKDWNAIANDLDKDLQEEGEGGDPLMNMFKEI